MWGKLLGLFSLSTIKFMFGPFGGPALGLSFIETYLSCILGAMVSASVFYFASEYFFKKAHDKKAAHIAAGTLKPKKAFTKTNRMIVNLKRKVGIVGVCFIAPFLLSIPGGTIITAKFYGKRKITYPLILIGICCTGAVTTTLAYLVFH
jgi:hypothetical protein